MKWIIWVIGGILAGLWTAAMALAALVIDWTGQALQRAGATSGEPLPVPAELPPWLVVWIDSADWAALGHALQQTMSMLPTVAAAASWLEALVWIVWAIGLFVLVCIALGLHGLVNRQQRKADKAVAGPSSSR